VAFEEPTITSVMNGEAVVPIIVGGTAGGPSVAARANAFETGEQIDHGLALPPVGGLRTSWGCMADHTSSAVSLVEARRPASSHASKSNVS
jgi:hypothetical protein